MKQPFIEAVLETTFGRYRVSARSAGSEDQHVRFLQEQRDNMPTLDAASMEMLPGSCPINRWEQMADHLLKGADGSSCPTSLRSSTRLFKAPQQLLPVDCVRKSPNYGR